MSPEGNKPLTIAVVGSINLDLVARVERFPLPGETVTDAIVSRFHGGKGANQAIAARRLGAQVAMLGCVGDDPVAQEVLRNLREHGVDVSGCRTLDGCATGLALINVTAAGENQIVVAPGANAGFAPELLALPPSDAVIAQLEIPLPTVRKAAETCRGFFCLNAAPARDVPEEILALTDLLVVNEGEAQALGDKTGRFGNWLAITLGAAGAVLLRAGEEVARAKPPRVAVVDTTGAGDAFTAALTVAMLSGMPPAAALQRACIAGALTATRPGAQSSPSLAEIERLEAAVA